jgi:lipopolysaccharide assembly protein A
MKSARRYNDDRTPAPGSDATDPDDETEPPQSPDRHFRVPVINGRTPDAATKLVLPDRGGAAMRWLHIGVVALFVVATLIFVVQNLEIVTLSFLGLSVRTPLALLVVIFYLFGMATGGSLFALLRRSIARSRFKAMTKS